MARITASMSQNNNITTLYAGIDIAKATLQLSLGGAAENLTNDPKGHACILKRLSAAEIASYARERTATVRPVGGSVPT